MSRPPPGYGFEADALRPGFHHQVLDAQASFRAALTALSRPGRVVDMPVHMQPPPPLGAAASALALTLFDADTPVWLDTAADGDGVRALLRFHCGAVLVEEPGAAAFAILAAPQALPELHRFAIGDELYPDRSCTLIVEVESLRNGAAARLTGPGIDGVAQLQVSGLPADFARLWAANRVLYPQGVDLFLTCGTQCVGLPRSVAWEA